MRALFLDRDGVINEDVGYPHKSSDLRFVPGIFELASLFFKNGFQIFIVTNQSGLARGIFSLNDLFSFNFQIFERFRLEGLVVTDLRFCPHHISGVVKQYSCDCDCRKPKPGMVLDLASQYNIALEESYMIGDKVSDMVCAYRAGVHNRILIGKSFDSAVEPANYVFRDHLSALIGLRHVIDIE